MGRKRAASGAPRRGLGPLFSSSARELARTDGPSSASSSSPAITTVRPEAAAAASHTTPQETTTMVLPLRGESEPAAAAAAAAAFPPNQQPTIRFVCHHDPRSSRPSLEFSPISRTLPSAADVIRVGRYSEKDMAVTSAANAPSAMPVGFKSKVVSRRHCEFWFSNGQWYVRDVKSSSGTFLNHIRLSQPSMESRPWAVNDGDVIQLGIDFKGGEEMVFRCVKMRVECNRGWQKSLNHFNTATHERLRKLAAKVPKPEDDAASSHSSDCSICLLSIAPCQSLFVAPCSHVWHYKCIRPILHGPSWPHFLCPNCRAVSDLEAEIEEAIEHLDVKKLQGRSSLDESARQINGSTERANGMVDVVIQADESARDSHAAADSASPETPSLNNDNSVRPSSRHSHMSIDDGQLANAASHMSIAPAPPVDMLRGRALSSGGVAVSGSQNGTLGPMPIPAPSNGQPDGPLTPRNDIGPFVLDGSGGGGGSSGAGILGNLDGAVVQIEDSVL